MSISIKPLEDRIVIRQVEAEQTTASGLVIPDTAKEKPQEGEVIAVGPGRVDDNGNRIPVDVKVGDVVIYSRYGGTEVKYDGQEFQILSSRDVLAVGERGALRTLTATGAARKESFRAAPFVHLSRAEHPCGAGPRVRTRTAPPVRGWCYGCRRRRGSR